MTSQITWVSVTRFLVNERGTVSGIRVLHRKYVGVDCTRNSLAKQRRTVNLGSQLLSTLFNTRSSTTSLTKLLQINL